MGIGTNHDFSMYDLLGTLGAIKWYDGATRVQQVHVEKHDGATTRVQQHDGATTRVQQVHVEKHDGATVVQLNTFTWCDNDI